MVAVVPGARRAKYGSGSGGVAGYGASDWELSRRLRRTQVAAAGSALLVGHSHWCAAGSACLTCRASVLGHRPVPTCDPQPIRGELARLAGGAGRLAGTSLR